jgi:hypothetical protein
MEARLGAPTVSCCHDYHPPVFTPFKIRPAPILDLWNDLRVEVVRFLRSKLLILMWCTQVL